MAARSNGIKTGGPSEPACSISRKCQTALLSHGIAQGQFVTELEERHTLWDQPGKLKLLYWLTHGNLGTYLDAIALGEATGTTGNILVDVPKR